MPMEKAPVCKILPYSVVDGPGSRAAIFLQGCNIACAYCHNPETQRLCSGCGLCISVCPAGALYWSDRKVAWAEDKCLACDACIMACEHRATPKVMELDATQVFARIESSLPFIRGITVSGGECTLYPAFLEELFSLCQNKNLGCLIDSNGMTDFERYPRLLSLCDGIMLDVKAWDTAVYHRLTGAENGIVKKNLILLHRAGKLYEIRIVCLPGEVDVKAVLHGIVQTLGPDGTYTLPLKLIRFRPFGVRGRLESALPPTDEQMHNFAQEAMTAGFGNVLIL
jgi:YjjW family glycine radical enzyme activase